MLHKLGISSIMSSVVATVCIMWAGCNNAEAKPKFESWPGQGYWRLAGGLSIPGNMKLSGDDVTVKPNQSFLAVMGLGYEMDNRINLELTFERRVSGLAYTLPAVPNFSETKAKGRISAYSIKGNVYYDLLYFRDHRFVPYLGGGIGTSLNKFTLDKNFEQSITVSGAPVTGPGSISYNGGKRRGALAWSATLGGNYKINNNLSLNLAYQYNNSGKYSTPGEAKICSPSGTGLQTCSTLPLSVIEGETKAHEFIMGLRYVF